MANHKKYIHRMVELIHLLNTKGITTAEYTEKYGRHRNQFIEDREMIAEIYLPATIISKVESGRQKRFFLSRSEQALEREAIRDDMALMQQFLEPLKQEDPIRYERLRKRMEWLINDTALLPHHSFFFVDHIQYTIRKQCRIQLYNYRHNSSDQPKDYLLEPIKLTTANQQLYALDVEAGICKNYKLSRVGSLEPTTIPCSEQHLYQDKFHDAFGWSCDAGQEINISFHMSETAYRLLCEEFEEAKQYVQKLRKGLLFDSEYQFKGPVAGVEAVGRFILGLSRHIGEIQPSKFKEELKKLISEDIFL
ncbi:WYL domain-containing protein [Algivirga pacifica]|uniref:WYL domain-containing protein n=1 Tax=Algivirga pacifica TaxID=1162670 RepID=A0ABP9DMU5_9BACT